MCSNVLRLGQNCGWALQTMIFTVNIFNEIVNDETCLRKQLLLTGSWSFYTVKCLSGQTLIIVKIITLIKGLMFSAIRAVQVTERSRRSWVANIRSRQIITNQKKALKLLNNQHSNTQKTLVRNAFHMMLLKSLCSLYSLWP